MIKLTLAIFVFCFVIERLFTGWKLPKPPLWAVRVLLANAVQLGVVLVAGYSWERWLSSASLFNLSQGFGPWTAGFIAYFVATFVFYWWHRLRHESDFFWRYFHQIHHSPQRLEVITSFYKHPLEMICNSVIGSLLIYTFLGLSPEAGAIYTLLTALGEFFYHTNVKTPRWVGFVFQRPEMHRIHHQRDSHKNNYGDFAIWDMIFGTYENPKTWSHQCGFTTSRELRLIEMLRFKDVHKLLWVGLLLLPMAYPPPAEASSPGFSSWEAACNASRSIVEEGDLIFLDIPSFLFREVARSTNTWTSHVGIAFKNTNGHWVVRESKIPRSTETPLCEYLARSSEYKFEVRRYRNGLNPTALATLKTTSKAHLDEVYHLGFDLDSNRQFCSKYVYTSYQSIGISVGEIQSFQQLLIENPHHSTVFWKFWFFGNIPWDRRTITPGSQVEDVDFVSVLRGHKRQLPTKSSLLR